MPKHTKLFPIQILAIGFGLVIFTGGILLSLPFCSADGKGLPFIDGLFTAVSATCVTGLAVYDTYSQFNFSGQLIILLLIQIGGLGFMGIAMTFSFFIGRRVSVFQRSLLTESIGTMHMRGASKTLRRMLVGTLFFEGTGTLVIAACFFKKIGPAGALWYGIFHSVSAFCNAGFDLMGRFEPGSSLTLFYDSPVLLITIMILICAGGIGFIVWNDIADYKFHFRKYTLHSKIMLTASLFLIFSGTVFFYLLESHQGFARMTSGEKILNALFASISPRTAGFNTVAYSDMTSAGRFFTIILMFIGAGPGSTGGGIKVTTFAAILLSIYSYANHYSDLSIFRRRLPSGAQRKAFSNTSFYLFAILLCTLFLLMINPHLSLESCLFETVSAMGTVGLTLGITSDLGMLSKIFIIILMYLGRLGSISVAMAIVRRRIIPRLSYPEEEITIG